MSSSSTPPPTSPSSPSSIKAKGECVFDNDNLGERNFPEMCGGPIDVVYTWVNGSDPDFQAQLHYYRPRFLQQHGLEEDLQERSTAPPVACPEGYFPYHSGSHCCEFALDKSNQTLGFNSDSCFNNSYVPCPGGAQEGRCGYSCPEDMIAYHLGSHCCNFTMDRDGKPLLFESDTCWGNQYTTCPGGPEDGRCIPTIVNLTDSDNSTQSQGVAMLRQRFRDNEELRYSLRSLYEYAPWIRHIYIVTNGQIPNWLNLHHPRLTMISHEDILPWDALPTFASPSIETGLHKIPGLADRFVYFNDDIMLGSKIWPDDFYTLARGQKIFLAWAVPSGDPLPCSPGCAFTDVGNGYCDLACNVSQCDYDSNDCEPDEHGIVRTRAPTTAAPTSVYSNYFSPSRGDACNTGCVDNWLGDGVCDRQCKLKVCGFDLGDCGIDSVIEVLGEVGEDEDGNWIAELDEDTPGFYVNVSALGQVLSASHDGPARLRAAIISKKEGILSVLLRPAPPKGFQCPPNTTAYHKGSHCCNFTVDRDGLPLAYDSDTCKNNTYVPCPGGAVEGRCMPKGASEPEDLAINFRLKVDGVSEEYEFNVTIIDIPSPKAPTSPPSPTFPTPAPTTLLSYIYTSTGSTPPPTTFASQGTLTTSTITSTTTTSSASTSLLSSNTSTFSLNTSSSLPPSSAPSLLGPLFPPAANLSSSLQNTSSSTSLSQALSSSSSNTTTLFQNSSSSEFPHKKKKKKKKHHNDTQTTEVNVSLTTGDTHLTPPTILVTPTDETIPTISLPNTTTPLLSPATTVTLPATYTSSTTSTTATTSTTPPLADTSSSSLTIATKPPPDTSVATITPAAKPLPDIPVATTPATTSTLTSVIRNLNESLSPILSSASSPLNVSGASMLLTQASPSSITTANPIATPLTTTTTTATTTTSTLAPSHISKASHRLKKLRMHALPTTPASSSSTPAATAPVSSYASAGRIVVSRRIRETTPPPPSPTPAPTTTTATNTPTVNSSTNITTPVSPTPLPTMFYAFPPSVSSKLHRGSPRGLLMLNNNNNHNGEEDYEDDNEVEKEEAEEDEEMDVYEYEIEEEELIMIENRARLERDNLFGDETGVEEEEEDNIEDVMDLIHLIDQQAVRAKSEGRRKLSAAWLWLEQALLQAIRGEEEEPLAVFPQRRLLEKIDTFAESLKWVNALYDAELGHRSRNVPAHMPHFMDKHILERLHARWPVLFNQTAHHRFRHPRDMQFALSYYYYLIQVTKTYEPLSAFEAIDRDGDGVISGRADLQALRLALGLELPELKKEPEAWSSSSSSSTWNRGSTWNSMPTPAPERKDDGEDRVFASLLLNVSLVNLTRNVSLAVDFNLSLPVFLGLGALQARLIREEQKKPLFKHQLEESDQVEFFMVGSDVTKVKRRLAELRTKQPKFICLNDDMGPDADGQLALALKDFYTSYLPKPSPLELPTGQVHGYTSIAHFRSRSQGATSMVLRKLDGMEVPLLLLFAFMVVLLILGCFCKPRLSRAHAQ